jgi:uncharacterized protein YndB with AHSA1/START domain
MVAQWGNLFYRDVQPIVAESGNHMEYGSIERQFYVDASPDVVFEVISSPEHIRQWWSADTEIEAVSGATGELVWGDETTPRANVVPMTVVDAQPFRLFSFRWCHAADQVAGPSNSLLVQFELTPSGSGTSVHLTESGFREMGWEAAVLEQHYNEHIVGWDTHLGHMRDYLTQLVATG